MANKGNHPRSAKQGCKSCKRSALTRVFILASTLEAALQHMGRPSTSGTAGRTQGPTSQSRKRSGHMGSTPFSVSRNRWSQQTSDCSHEFGRCDLRAGRKNLEYPSATQSDIERETRNQMDLAHDEEEHDEESSTQRRRTRRVSNSRTAATAGAAT